MADTTLKEGTRLDGLLNDHILYTDGGSEICGRGAWQNGVPWRRGRTHQSYLRSLSSYRGRP